jgi:hypothetical protein
MKTMIAYCGIDCGNCPSYIATQSKDRDELEKTTEMWRKQYNAPDMTVESIMCDGCMNNGLLSGYCGMCKVRACASGKDMTTCAECKDYQTCTDLAEFHKQAVQAKLTLDGFRVSS